jgi:protein-S-isoprenylcysteine O-methyltransferase Ste14
MMTLFFWVIIIAQILATISIVFSILFPAHRIWPPDKSPSWKHYFMWFLFDISTIGIVVVGILDWGSFALPSWMQIVLGVPLSLGGLGFSLWSIVILGPSSTYGNEGLLILRGPYCLSRNPQYLGFIVTLIGWSIVTSSGATILAALVWIIPLVLIPFAEEPWLLQRHGSEYEAYLRKVPRFVSLKKKKRNKSA